MSSVSTIIPLSDFHGQENNGGHNIHYQSPNDQSNYITELETTSTTSTLSFRDLKYTLPETRTNHRRGQCCSCCLKSKSFKRILNKVSGIFTSGMNAIMGKNLLYFKYLKNIFIFI